MTAKEKIEQALEWAQDIKCQAENPRHVLGFEEMADALLLLDISLKSAETKLAKAQYNSGVPVL